MPFLTYCVPNGVQRTEQGLTRKEAQKELETLLDAGWVIISWYKWRGDMDGFTNYELWKSDKIK